MVDFSPIQGYLGWRYGYFDGALTSSAFKELSWNSAGWWGGFADYWTAVDQIGGHPHGPISTRPAQVEQWAVRRWTSDFTGEVSISGILNDINRGGGGDGVTGRIFVDGLEVYSSMVNHSSPSVGLQYQLSLRLAIGNMVDFVIGPNAWDGDDSSEFTASIAASLPPSTGTESVPGPSPLLAMSSAFYGTRRLRKRINTAKTELRTLSHKLNSLSV